MLRIAPVRAGNRLVVGPGHVVLVLHALRIDRRAETGAGVCSRDVARAAPAATAATAISARLDRSRLPELMDVRDYRSRDPPSAGCPDLPNANVPPMNQARTWRYTNCDSSEPAAGFFTGSPILRSSGVVGVHIHARPVVSEKLRQPTDGPTKTPTAGVITAAVTRPRRSDHPGTGVVESKRL